MSEEIVQLKCNKIPKGLVTLEINFDEHENLQKYKPATILEEMDKVNLWNENFLKEILIGKCDLIVYDSKTRDDQ